MFADRKQGTPGQTERGFHSYCPANYLPVQRMSKHLRNAHDTVTSPRSMAGKLSHRELHSSSPREQCKPSFPCECSGFFSSPLSPSLNMLHWVSVTLAIHNDPHACSRDTKKQCMFTFNYSSLCCTLFTNMYLCKYSRTTNLALLLLKGGWHYCNLRFFLKLLIRSDSKPINHIPSVHTRLSLMTNNEVFLCSPNASLLTNAPPGSGLGWGKAKICTISVQKEISSGKLPTQTDL